MSEACFDMAPGRNRLIEPAMDGNHFLAKGPIDSRFPYHDKLVLENDSTLIISLPWHRGMLDLMLPLP
jgi:hypothetical protein